MNEEYIIQQLNKANKYMKDFIESDYISPFVNDGIIQFDKRKLAIKLYIFLKSHIVIDYFVAIECITSYENFLAMIKVIIKDDFKRRGII